MFLRLELFGRYLELGRVEPEQASDDPAPTAPEFTAYPDDRDHCHT